jgi:hypothetical protein
MSPRHALPFQGSRSSKLIGKGVRALKDELPLNIDESATSFADGKVYIATTDTTVTAEEFAGQCARYIAQPLAGALHTLVLADMLRANGIPAGLLLSMLGRLQHTKHSLQPITTGFGETKQPVLCMRVQTQPYGNEFADVTSMLANTVPKVKWLRILPPPWLTSCSERIRRAREAGCRLILIDARSFPQRPLNNLLRLLQNNLDAQSMHRVLMLSHEPLSRGIKEEGLMLVPFDFSTAVGQYQHSLRDEEANMLV